MYIAHVKGDDKTLQLLETHLFETAEIAASLANKIGLEHAGRVLGLAHDLGKYSSSFQRYLASATDIDYDLDENNDEANQVYKKGSVDHSTAGAQFLYRQLRPLLQKYGKGELVGQILALCVASHHSGLIDCANGKKPNKLLERLEKPEETAHFEEVMECIDKSVLQKLESYCAKELVQSIFAKVSSIRENLAINEYLETEVQMHIGFFVKFLFSCLIDADRINSAEFELPKRKTLRLNVRQTSANWSKALECIESKLSTLNTTEPINIVRKEISKQCTNRAKDPQAIYTMTVPTGGGKTFASLRYAILHSIEHKLDRIIFVIPFTSIIEQNAQAVRNLFASMPELKSWVLEHHSNLEPEQQTWESKIFSENWELPIIFTTSVQVLEAMFSAGTKNARRLHPMARSVMVFDEIQSLPHECIRLFCHAANFLVAQCSTTIILCSATQPTLDRLPRSERGVLKLSKNCEIIDQPELLYTSLKRVDVIDKMKKGGYTDNESIKFVNSEFNKTKSLLVIGNTKKWVKTVYEGSIQQLPESKSNYIFHLSTGMCAYHRSRTIKLIKERLADGLPVLCISTQLIEAGVDISFKAVIRCLAGLDSIAQAAGRCNRNGELGEQLGNSALGLVHIINPANEKLTMLPTIEIGKQITQNVLANPEISDLLSIKALDAYFSEYLDKLDKNLDYIFIDEGINKSLVDALSSPIGVPRRNSEGVSLLPTLKQSFMTAGKAFSAINAPTKALLVNYEDSEALIAELCATDLLTNKARFYELLARAQQFSINVFEFTWRNLLDNQELHEISNTGIFYTSSYDKKFGLSEMSESSSYLF